MALRPRFRAVLLEALKYFSEHGYSSESELQDWLMRLRTALEHELPSDMATRAEIGAILGQIFKREVVRDGIQRRVRGVSRYTLDRIAPSLRAELDRRIFASADLIRLNKAAAVEKTMQRFSGWLSSVPPAGFTGNVREVAREVLKPTAQLKFERRRVAIDQGHKLSSAVASIVAGQSGAIAAIWHDRGQYDHGYDARPEHLKWSGDVLLIRDSWAIQQGLVRKGALPYVDEREQPAELVYCSCWYEYITAPRDLPADVLTAKGRAFVAGIGLVRQDATPTPAQREAGNYAKKHLKIGGLDISIETAKNELRHGVGPDGTPWAVSMPADYGYIRRTTGADGEQLDCYLGPNPETGTVYVVEQRDLRTGAFDEHKALIGFGSRGEALAAYSLGFSDGMGPARAGEVLAMPMDVFKRWLPYAGKSLSAYDASIGPPVPG